MSNCWTAARNGDANPEELKGVTATIVAAIARALHHGCAVDAGLAAEAGSLRVVNALMRLGGVRANEGLPRWAQGMEGWREETYWSGDERHSVLVHETAGGRLAVKARQMDVEVAIRAGGAGVVCGVTFSACGGVSIWTDSRFLPPDRPDRLALLRDIDAELGGELRRAIAEATNRRAAALILEAFDALQRQEDECHAAERAHAAV